MGSKPPLTLSLSPAEVERGRAGRAWQGVGHRTHRSHLAAPNNSPDPPLPAFQNAAHVSPSPARRERDGVRVLPRLTRF